jgi:integrase
MARRKKNDYQELLALPYVHERDGKPYIRLWYQDAGGKWKSRERRVDTVEEALRLISQTKRDLGLRGPEGIDGERMTFAELLDQFIIDNPKMPDWYISPLREYFANRRIITITYADLKRFKTAREQVPNKATGKPRSTTTINRELEWLRAVLLYAVRHKWLAASPFGQGDQPLISKIEEQTRDRVPTPEEEARILAWCVGGREHLRAILIAARDTGLRKSVILGLTWSNVDFKVDGENLVVGDFLRIPPGSRYKKRPKVIALTARLRAELQALWEKPEKPEESEKPEKSKKAPDAKIFGGIKDVKRSYTTACRKAGVTGLHFHDWRHGFATDLMEAGVEERLAMRAAGHTSADTHAIYTNVDERLALHIAGRLDQLHRSRQSGEAVTASELVN